MKKAKRTPAEITADSKRTGRPPLQDVEPRNVLFVARITKTENREWRKQAKRANKAFGAWVLEPRRAEKGERHG
jgi:hypothetical protein